jgi:hypothetical protein
LAAGPRWACSTDLLFLVTSSLPRGAAVVVVTRTTRRRRGGRHADGRNVGDGASDGDAITRLSVAAPYVQELNTATKV